MDDCGRRILHEGDRVSRIPGTHSQVERKATPPVPLTGTVVYVHPEGRYHVVEFSSPKGLNSWRESFRGCYA